MVPQTMSFIGGNKNTNTNKGVQVTGLWEQYKRDESGTKTDQVSHLSGKVQQTKKEMQSHLPLSLVTLSKSGPMGSKTNRVQMHLRTSYAYTRQTEQYKKSLLSQKNKSGLEPLVKPKECRVCFKSIGKGKLCYECRHEARCRTMMRRNEYPWWMKHE